MKIAIIARSNKRRRDESYGCCVAGITEDGEWVRLVADELGDSLPNDDDLTPEVNTVIDANIESAPLVHQPENAVLGNWCPINDRVDEYIDLLRPFPERYIFGNASNRLSNAEMSNVEGSLRLVEVENLEIYKNRNNKWKVRFGYKGNDYADIAMTDPKHYRVGFIGDALIVVSLPNDEFGVGGYYKFVAAVMHG